ncbi:hypothetical protein BSY239_20 [Hydrogenophaga sp. RAC07]|uniref:DUF2934 domain-containing protein n=1 Tax=Hydrogenophaga sp. RAC07 TaxID=1842537 RepID=UPI00083D22E7|nr:DUF2934 domain-containing protein [Hydrogenophaga sp. RAC07]AOF87224.1 hypothetical protein BSY239_20 [Hydrogenophaga sp. RAC07]
MKQTSGSAVGKKALIKRPPMAVVSQGDGHARADGPGSAQAGPSREERIHEVAYALYEARGCVDGHDLEDWLAAEASVAREDQGAPSGGSLSEH